jgi:hypothetical protein
MRRDLPIILSAGFCGLGALFAAADWASLEAGGEAEESAMTRDGRLEPYPVLEDKAIYVELQELIDRRADHQTPLPQCLST